MTLKFPTTLRAPSQRCNLSMPAASTPSPRRSTMTPASHVDRWKSCVSTPSSQVPPRSAKTRSKAKLFVALVVQKGPQSLQNDSRTSSSPGPSWCMMCCKGSDPTGWPSSSEFWESLARKPPEIKARAAKGVFKGSERPSYEPLAASAQKALKCSCRCSISTSERNSSRSIFMDGISFVSCCSRKSSAWIPASAMVSSHRGFGCRKRSLQSFWSCWKSDVSWTSGCFWAWIEAVSR